MKISELISKLEETKEVLGDVDILDSLMPTNQRRTINVEVIYITEEGEGKGINLILY